MVDSTLLHLCLELFNDVFRERFAVKRFYIKLL